MSSFERRVKLEVGSRGRIDCILDGVILVEQKSAGINLNAAYEQAINYIPGLKPEVVPQYVMVCDFRTFRLYDEKRYNKPPESRGPEYIEFSLEKLHEHVDAFNFLIGAYTELREKQVAINIEAAQKLGVVHNLLEEANYSGKELEILMVRILFCLFAEDTGIFPQDGFRRYLEHRTSDANADIGPHLTKLFQILNTLEENRASTLDPELQVLPYVNGGLFSEKLEIADFTKEMRASILDAAHLDWSGISPDIFGSLFQSIKDKEHRRQEGQHYTSENNIRKCLDPLFLDELEEELKGIKSVYKLKEFQKKLGAIKILDPACGSGNFLIVAYRELRRLEHKVLLKLQKQGELVLDIAGLIQVEVDNFYGIEMEEWAAQIAQVSLWLVEHQMNREVSESLGEHYVRLPLSDNRTIVTGNAIELDWSEVVDAKQLRYIVGNPPFVGDVYQTTQQKEDILRIFKLITKRYKSMDYVCCWFVKSLEMLKSNPEIRTALVSTNSITQGELVEPLWGYMLKEGAKIQFAHRTFLWGSEDKGKAAVCCVVIGFGMKSVEKAVIYEYENVKSINPTAKIVKNINPYLVDAPNILVKSTSKPLATKLQCVFGNMPTDGGYLSKISREEKDEWLAKEPFMSPYLKKLIGGYEFLNSKERYCLWLKDVDPSIWSKSRIALERIQKVREFRLSSNAKSTREYAKCSYLFRQIADTKNLDYLAIPRVSSENRKYIPVGFINKSVICGDSNQMIPGAGLYEFGILTSLMHNSWMRVVCGRLKSDYRYSRNLVYNPFIWPEVTEDQKQTIESLAQSILDVRNKYPDSSLATLYNPNTMTADLVKAHDKMDRAVDRLYRKKTFESEMERVSLLFELYEKEIKKGDPK